MRLTLADMTLTGADGVPQPFQIFAGHDWAFSYDRGATAEGRVRAASDLFSGRDDAIHFLWDQDAQRTTVGALLNYPERGPIPAIVSRRMQQANGLTVGPDAPPFQLLDIGRQLSFRSVGRRGSSLFDYPHRRDPQGRLFMVVTCASCCTG